MRRNKRLSVKKERMEPCSSTSRAEEDHDLAYFIDDRVELMRQVFCALTPKEVAAMAPAAVRKHSNDDLEELCLEELLGISSKRLCSVLDGAEPPSDTESSSDSDEMVTIELDSSDDGSQRSTTSNKNGQTAPKEGELENVFKWAIDAGYRMLDSASAYKTEAEVGRGVAQSGIKRNDMFVVTKLGMNEKRDVVGALRKSLQRLNMDYVDLYLIHNPVSFTPDHSKYDVIDYLDTWKGMEEAKKLGLAKSIGISNFNESQIHRLLDNCKAKPAVLQIEVNLELAQNSLTDLCKKNDIVIMAYSPFGGIFNKDPETKTAIVEDPALVAIAEKYRKTVAQIVLRYLVQRGLVPIPKSTHKERIEQNIDIFDFELTREEMETLSKFNKDHRTVLPRFWQDHPYYPFEQLPVKGEDPFKG